MNPNIKQVVSASCPQSWTGGLDWIRVKLDWTKDARPAIHEALTLQDEDRARASNTSRWSFQGYRGWQTDSLRWGQRGGEVLWESSGATAASILARMGKFGGSALRIDLQTTFKLSSGQPQWGTLLIGSPTTTKGPGHTTRTPRGWSLATNGLWLGTAGKRTSPRYIRVYDKGVESKSAPQGTVWRVEVEAKYRHARKLWATYSETLNQPEFCAQYCVQSLTRSGCSWPFGPLSSTPVDVGIGRKESTTPGRLAMWMAQSVAPTIPRLLTVFTVAEVLEILKLSDVAAPIGKVNAHAPPTRLE